MVTSLLSWILFNLFLHHMRLQVQWTPESQFIALKYKIGDVGIAVVLLPHLRMPHSHEEKYFIHFIF